MYPAIARTFRTAGFQWITQFAYDPIDMAYANTEYQTHFLNLAYTPNKAISMMVAAETAFDMPMGKSYGVYPADTVFGNARVSFAEDLSVWNSPEKFYYSNNTSAVPVSPIQLWSIAGCGSSPVVNYPGTGAYFIDRLEEGIWRLEVMPDAIEVSDPFAKPSLKKEVVAIVSGQWDMSVNIPDLGIYFTVTPINAGNTYPPAVTDMTICAIRPGT